MELPPGASQAETIAILPAAERERRLTDMAPTFVRGLPHSWSFWARAGRGLAHLADPRRARIRQDARRGGMGARPR